MVLYNFLNIYQWDYLRSFCVVSSIYCTTVVLQYDLLDSETKVQRVHCPVSLELCPLDIALLG